MRMTALGAKLVLAMAVGGVGCANGMGTGPAEPAPGAEEPGAERSTAADTAAVGRFLAKVKVINDGEVRAGTIAQSKQVGSASLQYARMLEQQHRQANQWVEQVAQQVGVSVDEYVPEAREALLADIEAIQRLETLEGETFEDQFLTTMVAGHRSAIDEVRRARGQLDQPQVQQLIDRLLPVLEQHLEVAQQIQKSRRTVGSAL